jgi:hypothetical protein
LTGTRDEGPSTRTRSSDNRGLRREDPPGAELGLEFHDVDFSTPDGEKAIRAAVELVLEVRNEQTGPLARKVVLYERTFGLAVLPVLARRAIINLWRHTGRRRRRAD